MALLDNMQHVDTRPPFPEHDGRRFLVITSETREAYKANYHINYTNLPLDMARYIDLNISKATAYWLAHSVGLEPKRPCLKPPLKPKHMEDRVVYAHWGLLVPLECFIFTDEMWLRVGAASKKLQNVWRPPMIPVNILYTEIKGPGFL